DQVADGLLAEDLHAPHLRTHQGLPFPEGLAFPNPFECTFAFYFASPWARPGRGAWSQHRTACTGPTRTWGGSKRQTSVRRGQRLAKRHPRPAPAASGTSSSTG